jgi:crotonobetainyl-CoA:carnitine CoA-transferase CaiB-like acyl-CoA transferase
MTRGMLAGVTVLELGQVIAGNFGGVILADLGAEVIKIEPLSGDTARNATIAPIHDESAIHLFMNRGKKSVVLNLKDRRGLEVFYSLVAQADVVIDNFRPGVLGRLGVDHGTLEKHNPKVITTSITGFGEYGPARDKPAFDLVVQAYSGHVAITGPADGEPARVGIPIADIAGGIYSCIAVLASLVGRELHGKGGHADVAMLDTLVSMLSYDAVDYLNTGRKLTRLGTSHAHLVPWQAFPTLDGYVVVAARDEKFWQNLCDAIGRPDLKDDERTRDNTARVANRDFLIPLLTGDFLTKTTSNWLAILDAHDIPNSAVNDIEAVFHDPQVIARGMIRSYEHPTLGEIRYPPSPVKFSNWTSPDLPAPMLGEHTAEVLSERLGHDQEQIRLLVQEGVIKVWPDQPEKAD